MQVIGVVDLLGGCAVHARLGDRQRYRPVEAVAGAPIEPGDALALAQAYVDRLGIRALYAADLDAILGSPPQDRLVAELARLGAPLWLDAGVTSADRARRALDLGAARIVVGLETLPSYDALGEISAAVGGERVAFSLDLYQGQPVTSSRANGDLPADVIACRAADAGAGAVIVLDLARVGTSAGPDVELIARVGAAVRRLTLLAGGGIRGLDDLVRLAASGCDGALVATALHDGRLSAADVVAARRLGLGTRG